MSVGIADGYAVDLLAYIHFHGPDPEARSEAIVGAHDALWCDLGWCPECGDWDGEHDCE